MPSDGPLAAAADDVAVLRTILKGAGYTERGVSDRTRDGRRDEP